MTVKREKERLIIDWGRNEREYEFFNKQLKSGYPVFMVPSRKRTA
jgi:hypothetical protein